MVDILYSILTRIAFFSFYKKKFQILKLFSEKCATHWLRCNSRIYCVGNPYVSQQKKMKLQNNKHMTNILYKEWKNPTNIQHYCYTIIIIQTNFIFLLSISIYLCHSFKYNNNEFSFKYTLMKWKHFKLIQTSSPQWNYNCLLLFFFS